MKKDFVEVSDIRREIGADARGCGSCGDGNGEGARADFVFDPPFAAPKSSTIVSFKPKISVGNRSLTEVGILGFPVDDHEVCQLDYRPRHALATARAGRSVAQCGFTSAWQDRKRKCKTSQDRREGCSKFWLCVFVFYRTSLPYLCDETDWANDMFFQ